MKQGPTRDERRAKVAALQAALVEKEGVISLLESVISVMLEKGFEGAATISVDDLNSIATRAALAKGMSEDKKVIGYQLQYAPGLGPPPKPQRRLIVLPGE